jgi:hypothetical protein
LDEVEEDEEDLLVDQEESLLEEITITDEEE